MVFMSPALFFCLSPALADPTLGAEAVELGAADQLPLVDVLPTLPYFQTHVWEQVAQPGRNSLAGIAVSPDSPLRWLVADRQGTLFITDDGGVRWTLVLPGVEASEIDDEGVLLQAEVESADAFDGVDDADVEAESEAVSNANETAAAAIEANTRDAFPPTVWFDRAGSGVALFGREGQIWRSGDGGETWALVDQDDGATAFARVGGTLVAGGQSGVRASLDGGESWLDVDSALKGRQVRELTLIGNVLYAATDKGLFRSPNALQWQRVLAGPDLPLVSVLPDPDYTGGFWVAAELGVFRTDDGGETFFRFANQSLRELRRMVRLPEVGHLMAISGDGVWESNDGGVKWVPCSRLLSDPDVHAIAFSSGLPVIATTTGVWRLVKPERLVDLDTAAARTMPLNDVVQTALTREGMTGDLLALARRSRLTPLVPVLTVQFDADWGAGRGADFQVLASDGDRDAQFSGTATLCWGGCSGSTYYSYDTDSYDVQQLVDDGQLTVIDGKVYDENAVVAAAANVAQRLATFRVSTANQISEAWLTRGRLAAETATLADSSLRDRVMHQLAVQELDARLDAWTDGRFSTWTPESL